MHQVVRGQENSRWQKNNRLLMEPTLNHTTGKVFRGFCGTSFSAPHVTHIAARLERALLEQLGEPPSSNLIRSLLGCSAKYGLAMRTWVDSARDPDYTGKKNRTQEWRLRLIGYGKVDEKVLFSGDRQVTLFAEDKLDLRSLNLYKIPVPLEFLNVKGNKRISIGFAYNPSTRLSRKAYIANSLWVEVFRRTDADNLIAFIAKKESGNDEDAENIFEKFRNTYGAKFFPGYTEIQNERDRVMLGLIYSSGLKHLLEILPEESKRKLMELIKQGIDLT